MSETILQVLALIPALVIAIVFHEVAHGWTALMLGDPTARERRRLSLNPIRHVDPVGTLIVPGFLALFGGPIFGWAKPVPVDARRLGNPRHDMMLVGAAGPGTNLVLAAFGALLLGALMGSLGGTQEEVAQILDLLRQGYLPPIRDPLSFAVVALVFFILINTFLALFNLLPIPPFDGSHIVEGLLPRGAARKYAQLRQFGMFVIIVIIAASLAFGTGFIGAVIWPPVEWMLGHYYRLAQWAAGG